MPIECFQILMVGLLVAKERIVSGWQASRILCFHIEDGHRCREAKGFEDALHNEHW